MDKLKPLVDLVEGLAGPLLWAIVAIAAVVALSGLVQGLASLIKALKGGKSG